MTSNVTIVARLLAGAVLLAAAARSGAAQSVPILSVTFEGNKTVETAALKAQMRINRDGGWYSAEGLQVELRALTDFLQNSGFLRARVGPPQVEMRTVPNKGRVAVIRIPISEGTRYTLGAIQVSNAVVFKTNTLLQMSPLKVGQPYSRSKLGDWKEKIEEAYHTLGYIRAQVDFKEEVHDAKGVVDCVLECKEGNAYRIAKISISGEDSINRAEFKKLLLVGEGSLYNPEMVSLSLQFLNTLRVYRPMTDADVDIKIDEAKSTVELVFRVVPVRRPSS